MDIKLFNDVITGNKPIDLLSDKELAETAHDIDTIRNMLMEELTKRVPKYDVNTGTQILKLLLYAMGGEKIKMIDWISVKDKMPKCGELVLIYIANLNDGKGAYALDKCRKVDGKKEWEFYNKGNADFDVTHWAPLSKPPKEESDE